MSKSYRAFTDHVFENVELSYCEPQYEGRRMISAVGVNITSGTVVAVWVRNKGIVWTALTTK